MPDLHVLKKQSNLDKTIMTIITNPFVKMKTRPQTAYWRNSNWIGCN